MVFDPDAVRAGVDESLHTEQMFLTAHLLDVYDSQSGELVELERRANLGPAKEDQIAREMLKNLSASIVRGPLIVASGDAFHTVWAMKEIISSISKCNT